jgi:hypothetical protein
MARPLLSKAALVVVINPFASPLDEQGRPCTIVQFDPDHTPAGTIRRIGCSLDRAPLKDARKPGNGRGSPSQYPRFDTRVIYDLGAKPLPHSVYHVGLIREGALLPADEASARLCGVPFVPPEQALAKALRAAVAAWLLDHHGESVDPQRWVDAGQFTGWVMTSLAPPADPKMSAEERAEAAEIAAKKAAEEVLKALTDGVAAGTDEAKKIMEQRKARADRMAKSIRAAKPAPRGDA